MIRRGQRGDTIVEVMICIGVVGAVLAGAFVVSNMSQIGVRDAQERAEASKIVEGQLELLRSNTKLQGGTVFSPTTTGSFCMGRDARPKPNPSATAYASVCQFNNGGNQASGGEIAYKVAITHEDTTSGTGSAGQLFRIVVKWDSATGDGESQETMFYRLYP
jgi:type II secretory pathway pseudopilin PulG